MSSTAARVRRLSLVLALLLTGCGGGSSAIAPTVAGGGLAASVPVAVTGDPPAANEDFGPPVAGDSPAPATGGLPTPADAAFSNPLLASGPDPHVVSANGVYYYTHTSGDRIRLWATTAMSRLAEARSVTIFVPPSSGPNSRDLWAPELHRLDGRWYVYYTAGDGSRTAADPHASQRIFVLENESADPTQGTWVDRGRLRGPDPDVWAIDGTVMEHGDDRYFLWSGRAFADDPDQHIYIAKMSDPWTLAGGRVLLSSPDRSWERAGRTGVNEAPQVLRNRQGHVFLLYSANGCWTDEYSLGMLALREGGDPLNGADWVKSARPVFGTNAIGGVHGPGHNAFFKSPDGTEDWLIYHANSAPGQGCGGARTPRMQPIRWRDDGTPDFDTPVPSGKRIPVPSGEVAEG